jgi:hypothetical protein
VADQLLPDFGVPVGQSRHNSTIGVLLPPLRQYNMRRQTATLYQKGTRVVSPEYDSRPIYFSKDDQIPSERNLETNDRAFGKIH